MKINCRFTKPTNLADEEVFISREEIKYILNNFNPDLVPEHIITTALLSDALILKAAYTAFQEGMSVEDIREKINIFNQSGFPAREWARLCNDHGISLENKELVAKEILDGKDWKQIYRDFDLGNTRSF